MKNLATVSVMVSMLALALLVLPMLLLAAMWAAERPLQLLRRRALLAGVVVGWRMGALRVPGPLDDNLLLVDTVTKVATFNTDAFDLGAGFDPEGVGMPVAAVIAVSAGDRANSDETYIFKLQESADGSTNWTDIGVSKSVTVATTVFTTGTYVCKGFASLRYLRLVCTIAGTTPSITYKAWLKTFRLAA